MAALKQATARGEKHRGNADTAQKAGHKRVVPSRSEAENHIYAPLQQFEGMFPLKEVFGVLAAVGTVLVTGLATGVVLRGGVTFGPCAELENGQIYGPALAEAYRLESEVADYPRVVVGKPLEAFLRHVRANPTESPLSFISHFMAEDCLKRTCIDDDGLLIVDAVRFINDTSSRTPEGPVVLIKAKQFIEQERAKFLASGNHKLTLRYSRLKRYFDARFVVK